METKKQFKWFTIFEYEKEQEYLQQMHRSGWKFVKVTGFGMYHFKKCSPQDEFFANRKTNRKEKKKCKKSLPLSNSWS